MWSTWRLRIRARFTAFSNTVIGVILLAGGGSGRSVRRCCSGSSRSWRWRPQARQAAWSRCGRRIDVLAEYERCMALEAGQGATPAARRSLTGGPCVRQPGALDCWMTNVGIAGSEQPWE